MKRNFKTAVVSYSLDGKLVRIYPSAKAASISKRVYKRTIDRAIRGDLTTVKKLQWRRFKIDEIPNTIDSVIIKNKTISIRPVAKIDEEGNIIEVYPSIKNAAEKNNLDLHSLRDRLNKKYEFKGKDKYRLLNADEIETFHLNKGKEISNKIRPIVQYDLDGKYIKTYPSINAALKALNKTKNNNGIRLCLAKKYKTAFGYKWRYK